MYKLADEPPMKYSMLATMDGNNSLKLMDSTFWPGSSHIDDRITTSSQWITAEDVDRFKDEVATSLKKVTFLLMYLVHFLTVVSIRCQLPTLHPFQGHQPRRKIR